MLLEFSQHLAGMLIGSHHRFQVLECLVADLEILITETLHQSGNLIFSRRVRLSWSRCAFASSRPPTPILPVCGERFYLLWWGWGGWGGGSGLTRMDHSFVDGEKVKRKKPYGQGGRT